MTLLGKLKFLSCIVFLGLLTATLVGCASSPGPRGEPEESPPGQADGPEGTPVTAAKSPAKPQPVATPTQVAAPPMAPASSESKKPQETKALPKGLQELQEKLQPGGAAAQTPKKPDEETLKKEAEAFVKKWLEALQKGDVEEAEKFAVSSDVLQGAMSPGHREILEGTILSQNHLVMDRLCLLLKGKEIEHQWQPGSFTETPARHVFKQSVPSLSSGVLQVDASGIVAEIHLEQLGCIHGIAARL